MNWYKYNDVKPPKHGRYLWYRSGSEYGTRIARFSGISWYDDRSMRLYAPEQWARIPSPEGKEVT